MFVEIYKVELTQKPVQLQIVQPEAFDGCWNCMRTMKYVTKAPAICGTETGKSGRFYRQSLTIMAKFRRSFRGKAYLLIKFTIKIIHNRNWLYHNNI